MIPPDLKGGAMKKGYWVVSYKSISDESAAKAYAVLALPPVQWFKGASCRAPRAGFRPTKPDCRCGLSSLNSTVMTSRWPRTIAKLTKRRSRFLAPARNATFVSLKARRTGNGAPGELPVNDACAVEREGV